MSTCILAKGYLTNGYATAWRNNKKYLAHRLAYIDAYGPIPNGMVVRHLCHVRNCVNPDHLTIGTQQDNMDDRQQAERQARGETNGRAILTEQQVIEIRKHKPEQGRTPRGAVPMLAKKYGVSKVTIEKILRRKLWKHI